jgi:hypothetical protein
MVHRRIDRVQTLAQVCGYLRSGSTRRAAAHLAGISESTLWRWLERSNETVRQIQNAEAHAETLAVDAIWLAITKKRDWRAAAWFLERRHSESWRLKETLEVEGNGLDVSQLLLAHLARPAANPEPVDDLPAMPPPLVEDRPREQDDPWAE